MSAALLNAYADPSKARAISAGTQPSTSGVHPVCVRVMQELGIDIADAPQQKLTAEVAQQAALLVTMGCGETCPHVPGDFADVHAHPCAGCRHVHSRTALSAFKSSLEFTVADNPCAGLEKLDWPLADPKHMPVEGAREVRDDAAVRVKQLIAERGWGKAQQ